MHFFCIVDAINLKAVCQKIEQMTCLKLVSVVRRLYQPLNVGPSSNVF